MASYISSVSSVLTFFLLGSGHPTWYETGWVNASHVDRTYHICCVWCLSTPPWLLSLIPMHKVIALHDIRIIPPLGLVAMNKRCSATMSRLFWKQGVDQIMTNSSITADVFPPSAAARDVIQAHMANSILRKKCAQVARKAQNWPIVQVERRICSRLPRKRRRRDFWKNYSRCHLKQHR